MSYSNYRAITIDHSKVPGTLTDFPILVSGTYSYLKSAANGGKVQSANGYDIAFFADSALTTQLDHEVESYDPATGAIVAWVRVPSVSSSADTVLYVAYSNSHITTDQSNKTGVWDSNYAAVLHLGTGNDSTSNGRNATAHNGATFGAASGLATGKGLSVTKKSSPYQYAEISGTLGSPASLTIEGWAKVTSVGPDGGTLIDISNNIGIQFSAGAPTGTWSYAATGVGNYPYPIEDTSHNPVNDGSYHYYVVTVTDGALKLYIDGTLKATQTGSGSPYYGTGNGGAGTVRIGADSTSSADNFSTSETIDEVRFSSVVRNADYIATTYASVSSPSTFYAVGSEQTVSTSTDYTQTLADTLTLTSILSRGAGKAWADSTSLVDAIRRAAAKHWVDSASLDDSIGKGTDKKVRDAFSLSDAFSKSAAWLRSFAESFSLSDLLSTGAAKMLQLSDSIGLTDAFSRAASFTRTLLDEFSPVDSIRKAASRVYADALSLGETVTRGTGKRCSDALSLTDSVRRAVGKALSEGLTLADSLSRRAKKAVTDSIILTDTGLRRVIEYIRSFADPLLVTDKLRRAIGKEWKETLSLFDRLMRQVSGHFSLALSESLVLADSLGKGLGRTMRDTISLIERFLESHPLEVVRLFLADVWRRMWPAQVQAREFVAETGPRLFIAASYGREWVAEVRVRDFRAGVMKVIVNVHKPAGSIEDFRIDWSAAIGNDTISESEWTVPDGLSNEQDSHTDTTATIRLSDSSKVGETFIVENKVTLASGQVKVQSLQIKIVN